MPLHASASTLRWLQVYRRAALSLLALALPLSYVFGQPAAPFSTAVVLWLLYAAIEAAQSTWLRRTAPPLWAPEAHLAMDVAFFAAFAVVFRLGGEPALSLLIVPVGLAAILLGPRRAWAFTLVILVLHASVAVFMPLASDAGLWAAVAARATAIVPFAVAAIWVTYFLTALRRTLGDGELRLQAALDDHARNERLVALGIQAAGIAHELGTPLSSIDMLAAEAQSDPEYAAEALQLLRDQVKRCRGILDRVRGSTVKTVSAEVESLGPVLREWLVDWSAAGLDREPVFTEIEARLDSEGIRGAADEWRGIIWSTLDNALKAGAPIAVRARVENGFVVLHIDDSGVGPTPEVAAQAGEPFFTSWAGGTGRGLGLYVARTFARKHGGDLFLSRREGGGGRLEIRFATIGTVLGEK